MSFYSNLSATAKKLLTQYGQSITLKYESGTTFDPVLGVESGGSTISVIGKGALFAYNRSEIDGEIIIQGDANLYLSITTEPVAGMLVTIAGVDWHIVGVTESNPAGTNIYYQCQVRK